MDAIELLKKENLAAKEVAFLLKTVTDMYEGRIKDLDAEISRLNDRVCTCGKRQSVGIADGC